VNLVRISNNPKTLAAFVRLTTVISVGAPFCPTLRAMFTANATIVESAGIASTRREKMGKAAAKKQATKRLPFDWARLKQMAESGASILEMAQATDPHFRSSKSEDKTKPTRARLSIAANKGIRIEGRLVRFKRRVKQQVAKNSKPRKAAPKKATKNAASKPKPVVKKGVQRAVQKPSVEPSSVEPKPEA
jgi:hypothetical protein